MAATVGFIGLGLMGQGFTKRLIARGFKVVGYDIAADKIAAAKAYGVTQAASPEDVARASDAVCLSVMSASGTHAVLASTLRMRAAASPVACEVSDPRSAPGRATTTMPGGWTNAKSL